MQLNCLQSIDTERSRTVLRFVGMNLMVQNHNHYITARTIYSVAHGREIEGMLCSQRLISQKQRCTELPLFLISLHHMLERESAFSILNTYPVQHFYL